MLNNKLTKENELRLLTQNKTSKDLIEVAFKWYGLDKTKTITILKEKGYQKFDCNLWWDYLNVLREEWDHVKALRKEQKEKEDKDRQLNILYNQLEIVVTPSCWVYRGPQEVLDDIERRSNKQREDNVKRFMRRRVPVE